MGTTEEVTKAAGSFIEGMVKTQPLSLALVVMNVCLLATLWSIWNSSETSRNKQMEMIFSAQREMQVLLSRCVVPDK